MTNSGAVTRRRWFIPYVSDPERDKAASFCHHLGAPFKTCNSHNSYTVVTRVYTWESPTVFTLLLLVIVKLHWSDSAAPNFPLQFLVPSANQKLSQQSSFKGKWEQNWEVFSDNLPSCMPCDVFNLYAVCCILCQTVSLTTGTDVWFPKSRNRRGCF